MTGIHIFTAPSQPATRFLDDHGKKPHWFRSKPRRLYWCDNCGKRRWAKYVRVQVYYDKIHRFCAPGHGCAE